MDARILAAIQQYHSPAADVFWQAVTLLGSEEMLAALWIALWCRGPHPWWWITIIFLGSLLGNESLKGIIDRPRPSPELFRILADDDEPSYSFPSGHAQFSMLLWGSMAWCSRSRWARAGFLLLPLLIGFSRVYLGRHWPTDVLAGWLVGAAWLALAVVGANLGASRWLERGWVAAALVALAVLIVLLHRGGDSVLRSMMMLAGGAAGYAVERARLATAPAPDLPGGWAAWLWRAALGLGGVVLLYVLLPGGPPLWVAVRFFIIGLWVTLLAPALFHAVPGTRSRATGLAGATGS